MPKIAAVILAGGKARRLNGQNKCDVMIGSKSCLTRLMDLFHDTTDIDVVAISVGTEDRYDHGKTHPVIFDWPTSSTKPSVAYAVMGCLKWAKARRYDAIITTPVDTPFLPITYANELTDTFNGQKPVVCKTDHGLQNLHAVWPVEALEQMRQLVLEEGIQKMSRLHNALGSSELWLEDTNGQLFANINDKTDLERARNLWPSDLNAAIEVHI